MEQDIPLSTLTQWTIHLAPLSKWLPLVISITKLFPYDMQLIIIYRHIYVLCNIPDADSRKEAMRVFHAALSKLVKQDVVHYHRILQEPLRGLCHNSIAVLLHNSEIHGPKLISRGAFFKSGTFVFPCNFDKMQVWRKSSLMPPTS